VPHWRVSGPSFCALLLLSQWRPFVLDAVRDHFPSFLRKGLQLVQTLCLQLLFADIALLLSAHHLRAVLRFFHQGVSVLHSQPKDMFSCALTLLRPLYVLLLA
jgi:hypothetical protein